MSSKARLILATVVAAVLSVVPLAGPSSPARATVNTADPVRSWNDLGLQAVRIKRASDAEVARVLAMVNVAMYDSVNAIEARCGRDEREPALVNATGAPAHAHPAAAAAAAAHAVLKSVYPDLAPRFDAQLTAELAELDRRESKQRGGDRHRGHSGVGAGRTFGAAVGAEVVARRTNDGASPHENQVFTGGNGQFIGTWGGVQYRNLRPFAISNPSAYVNSGPPPTGSLDYAAAFAEVKLLGNAAAPDADKLAIFQYWSLSTGTAQPPGEWVKIALTVIQSRALALEERTRLLALVSMALADTVAPTYTTKFIYAHWRPATAIRQAFGDDNQDTEPHERWSPRAGGIGTSPEYTSGHSSFSAAAAAVLAGFFCNDAIAFSHVSDSSPGAQPRSFDSFSAAAAEAGRSRVLGGIHFEFSNQAGLQAGRGVGAEVLAKKLLRKRGRTHFGQCPL